MKSKKSGKKESFLNFSLKNELLKAIKELGFDHPTPIQSKVIPHLMSSGQDLIASAQTGTGKTAAFGLPGLAVEEEEFLDFEDPMAKYAGALGGFVGFVAGAPMKLGAKAVDQKKFAFYSRESAE